jgi:TorA maturation chaperone TorD
MKTNAIELVPNIDALTVMHQLVAKLFKYPPDKGVVDYLRSIDTEDENDLFSQDEVCLSGIKLMKSFCSELEPDEAVTEANTDHNQLFVGPMHLPSPPWSSVYMDRGSLFGPTALAVEDEFKRFGFWIPEKNHEPCDHIAYEIQFVAEMNKKATESLRQGDEAEGLRYLEEARKFINTYLMPWLGTFLGRVEEHARTDFYRGLVKLTEGLVKLELQLLDNILATNTNLTT